MERAKYVASISFGKDSLCMVLRLIETGAPLDEVVFYDAGMEFQAIYDTRDRVLPILAEHGVKYTELHPQRPFLYDMLERPKVKRTGETVNGDSWCGGACRWGTWVKQRSLNRYIGHSQTYIGLASDENGRIAKLEGHKTAPLAKWGITEADALRYCYDHGFYWEEAGIRLYDILDRVSCWCCANKNLKELRNIRTFLPEYWERLKVLQSQTARPMKGLGKSVFDLEKRFAEEAAQMTLEEAARAAGKEGWTP